MSQDRVGSNEGLLTDINDIPAVGQGSENIQNKNTHYISKVDSTDSPFTCSKRSSDLVSDEKKSYWSIPIILNFLSFLFGFSTLMPWNSFIVASDFFLERLKPNTNLFAIFNSTLNISNMVPVLLCFFVNTFLLYKYKFTPRVISSLVIIFVGFLVMIVLIPINVDSFIPHYFAMIMITAAILGSCSSFLQSAFFALSAYFDPSFLTYFISGQAFAGLIISSVKVLIITGGFSMPVESGIYFGINVLTILICLVTYIFFQNSPYFKSKTAAHKDVANTLLKSDNEKFDCKHGVTLKQSLLRYLKIYKKIHIPANSLFMVCFITLAIFPALTMDIKSTSENKTWKDKYFHSVSCFLVFNIGDTLSRFLIKLFRWPKPNSYWMLIFCSLRSLFLILFLMCERGVESGALSGLLKNDAFPICFMFLFSSTNGYLMVLAFDSAPKLVSESEHELCNTLMSLFLGFGLAVGSFSSYLIKYIGNLC